MRISRRKLLSGGCVTALAFGIPIGPTKAFFPRGVNSTGNLSTAKTVVNGFDNNEGSSYMYANFAKSMINLVQTAPASPVYPDPTYASADGYPIGPLPGTVDNWSQQCGIPPSFMTPSVPWVAKWDGIGGVKTSQNVNGNSTASCIGSIVLGPNSNQRFAPNNPCFYNTTGSGGRVEFTFIGSPAAMLFSIVFGPMNATFFPTTYGTSPNNFRNFVLCRKSDEAAIAADPGAFTPEFLASMRALNPKVVRCMDMGRISVGNNLTTFAYRPSPTALSWHPSADHFNPGCWAGISTGQNDLALPINPANSPSGAYQQGETIQCTLATPPTIATVTGAVSNGGVIQLTLSSIANLSNGQMLQVFGINFGTIEANGQWQLTNVGGAGNTVDLVGSSFRNAYISGGSIISWTSINVAGRGKVYISGPFGGKGPYSTQNNGYLANALGTFVYDSWLNLFIGNISTSSNTTGGGIQTGAPIEAMVSMANQLNCHLWYSFPINCTDAFVTSTAAYVRDNLNPLLTWYPELGNECWNTQVNNAMCDKKGLFLGIPELSNRPYEGYYGLRTRQIMDNITAVWTVSRSTATLHRVLAQKETNSSPLATQVNMFNGADLNINTVNITGISASSGSPTITANNSYSQMQGIVLSGIVGTGAIAALNGMSVVALAPNSTSFVIGTPSGTANGSTAAGTTLTMLSGTTIAVGQYVVNQQNGSLLGIILSGSGNIWTLDRTSNTNGAQVINFYNPVSTAGGTYSSGGSVQTIYGNFIGVAYNVGSPTWSRPIDICDTISYATYYSGGVISNGGFYNAAVSPNGLGPADILALTTNADLFASGNPTSMAQALQWYDNDIRIGQIQVQSITLPVSGTTITTSPAYVGAKFVTVQPGPGSTLPTGLSATQQYNSVVVGSTLGFALPSGGGPVSFSGGSGTMLVGYSGNYGNTLIDQRTYYSTNWQPIAASYNGARAPGMTNVAIECYEGGYEGVLPTFAQCLAMGITTSSAVTLNIGSSPAVTWASQPLDNGAQVSFTTTGSLPGGISAYSVPNGSPVYFVVNASTNGFDVSLAAGGAPITLTGTQSGTQTCAGSNYAGSASRVALMSIGWKFSAFAFQLVQDQFTDFMNAGINSVSPGRFMIYGGNPWGIVNPGLTASPDQQYAGVAAYNH